jgi:hypothetical protein
MAGKKSRKSKKPLSPASLHKHAQSRAKKASASAKKRAQHYGRGDKLLKQATKTLNKVASSHPNPKARKQAKQAVRQLNEAHAAFGSASMCADSPTYNNGDT